MRDGLEANNKRKDTHKEILEAALNYFCENGIHSGVSMKQIAEVANMSRQNLYLYFSNIDELIFAVANQSVSQMLLLNKEFFLKHTSPIETIQNLLKNMFMASKDNPKPFLFLFLFDGYKYSKKTNRELEEKYIQMVRGTKGIDLEIIRGQKEGVIRKSIDPKGAGVALFNIFFALVQRSVVLKEKPELPPINKDGDRVIEELLEMVFYYLKA